MTPTPRTGRDISRTQPAKASSGRARDCFSTKMPGARPRRRPASTATGGSALVRGLPGSRFLVLPGECSYCLFSFFDVVQRELAGFNQMRPHGLRAAAKEIQQLVDQPPLCGIARDHRFEKNPAKAGSHEAGPAPGPLIDSPARNALPCSAMARKTEVYTWRVSAAMKAGLEEAARDTNRSVARLLDEIVAERLDATGRTREADIENQRRLHARAGRFAGRLSGGDPARSQNAKARVRARLAQQRTRGG